MEPIPSKPHASRNLAISLFVLVAVVLGGVYWYRYEHLKSLEPAKPAADTLSEKEKQEIMDYVSSQASTATPAEREAMLKKAEPSKKGQYSKLDEQAKLDLITKFNSSQQQ